MTTTPRSTVGTPRSGPDRVPAPAFVLTAIVAMQVGSALARRLFDDLGAAGVLLLRLAIAALVLLAVLRPKVRAWSWPMWRAALLLGAAMAGMNLAFYLSLHTVPLGIAVTVEFVGPLTLSLVQTRRVADLLWVVLAGGGVVLLGADTTSGIPLTGLGLALLAGAFWAGYILASSHVGRLLPGLDGLVVALAFGTLLVAPVGAAGAANVVGQPSLLALAAAVALLSSVLTYGLELSALRRMPTRVFGVLMSMEPAVAALAGLVLLGQRLGAREVAALAMVSVASAGVSLGQRRGAQPPAPLD